MQHKGRNEVKSSSHEEELCQECTTEEVKVVKSRVQCMRGVMSGVQHMERNKDKSATHEEGSFQECNTLGGN